LVVGNGIQVVGLRVVKISNLEMTCNTGTAPTGDAGGGEKD
jgi:hypothetical protein